jgi:hypothetical protein
MEFSYLSDITGNPVYKEKVDKVREVITRASRYIVREVIIRSSRYNIREVISMASKNRIMEVISLPNRKGQSTGQQVHSQ